MCTLSRVVSFNMHTLVSGYDGLRPHDVTTADWDTVVRQERRGRYTGIQGDGKTPQKVDPEGNRGQLYARRNWC